MFGGSNSEHEPGAATRSKTYSETRAEEMAELPSVVTKNLQHIAAFLTSAGKVFAAIWFAFEVSSTKSQASRRHVRCTLPRFGREQEPLKKEIIMKSFLLFIALICAVILTSSSSASV